MTSIRIKDAIGGFDLPPMEKEKAHGIMQEQYFSPGPDSVRYKDCHTKGIIINDDGFLFLQTRPPAAYDNCGLIDASWGSHVEAGDTILTSAMYESARELGIATTVLEDQYLFTMLENHPKITSELAITRQIAHKRNFRSERLLRDGKTWMEPCELTLFVSYFDGNFRPTPKDGAGIKYSTLNTLLKEIEEHPERFTYDLKEIVKGYSHLLIPYRQLPDFNPNLNPSLNELVQQYDMNGNPIEPGLRSNIHDPLIEAFYKGIASPAKHRHIRLMLKRPDDTFFLQQRSMLKKENPGVIDKPIAGHVGIGDTYDIAVIHECSDELAIAAAVLPEEDFRAIVKNRPEILKHQAVLMKVGVLENYVSKGRTLLGQEPWNELCDTAVYFGVYNGSLRFKDGETTGVEVRGLGELEQQLREHPEKYTYDLTNLVDLLKQRCLVA